MLPRIFKPQIEVPLIRIGSLRDGGYIIPVRALTTTDRLYSFGLGTNWDFEVDFYQRSRALVIVVDHTLDRRSWAIEGFKDVVALCTLYTISRSGRKPN